MTNAVTLAHVLSGRMVNVPEVTWIPGPSWVTVKGRGVPSMLTSV
jgi:hypothetical protein